MLFFHPQRNPSDPTQAILLLGDKYRLYGGLDGAKKVKLETRDGLSLTEAQDILRSSFGIDLTRDEMARAGFFDKIHRRSVQGMNGVFFYT